MAIRLKLCNKDCCIYLFAHPECVNMWGSLIPPTIEDLPGVPHPPSKLPVPLGPINAKPSPSSP